MLICCEFCWNAFLENSKTKYFCHVANFKLYQSLFQKQSMSLISVMKLRFVIRSFAKHSTFNNLIGIWQEMSQKINKRILFVYNLTQLKLLIYNDKHLTRSAQLGQKQDVEIKKNAIKCFFVVWGSDFNPSSNSNSGQSYEFILAIIDTYHYNKYLHQYLNQ